jgi:hypothetical protein
LQNPGDKSIVSRWFQKKTDTVKRKADEKSVFSQNPTEFVLPVLASAKLTSPVRAALTGKSGMTDQESTVKLASFPNVRLI